MKTHKTNRSSNWLIGCASFLLICIISICCLGVIFSDTDLLSTPTPFIIVPIETIVMQTYEAARIQTLAASTPVPLATYTLAPPPSATCSATLVPTWTPVPTFTSFVLNTLPPPSNPDCVCTQDV